MLIILKKGLKLLTFILINYNTKNLTYQAIKSIYKTQPKKDFEVILVDNASTDGSREYFEKFENLYDNFKYIYNNKNLGFGKANNIGFKYSKGNYIYIINSDTLLHTKNIHQIIEDKFRKYPEVGVIATKVIYEDGFLQPNVQKFSTLLSVSLRLLKIGEKVRNHKMLLNFFKNFPFKPKVVKSYLKNFDKERKESFIEWASGCSLIFKREVYEKLGGFDENFFMYTEDEEICYRVHKIGYKILYTPDIVVTHLEGKSNKNSKINEFLLQEKIKSEFYYYKKHFPENYKKLKLIYEGITFIGSFFSERLRIIRKNFKELKL
jgi:GT2 family glycosyltransferase